MACSCLIQCPDAVNSHHHYEQGLVVGVGVSVQCPVAGGSEQFCSWLIAVNIRTLAAKNPKVVLDEIVTAGEVKDVMLLRKAAASFTSVTVKGYVGQRFAFVNRLKTDMAKTDGIPTECQSDVEAVMEKWDTVMTKFQEYSAQEDDWTVEAGVSMTNVLLNLASELDTVHTAMSHVWDSVKKARKMAVAEAVKEKNSATKASNLAMRPFTKNGVGAAWKTLLQHLKLVSTGHVHDVAQAQSQEVTDEKATVIDWCKPHHWYGQLELKENEKGHR